jgi:S-methylmethionine-dependent homocysteine/selenocysteine methylase
MTAKYRGRLPQLEQPFLTDGGLETTLIFQQGVELPEFAAFVLLETDEGQERLRHYFSTYAAIAQRQGAGFVLESVTWRANPDWGRRLGYSDEALAEVNRAAVQLLVDLRAAQETARSPMVVSGCIGPRGDGYVPSALMDEAEAERYHAWQIGVFAETDADMVCALTMNYAAEAIGVARAAARAGMPVAISFTAETDGRLPTGQTLREAIERVDGATDGAPAYYMVNCAHPTHLRGAFDDGGPWLERVRGFRGNGSAKSHAELNESTELDADDPVALARLHSPIFRDLKNLRVVGGCCGTNDRHVAHIASAWLAGSKVP